MTRVSAAFTAFLLLLLLPAAAQAQQGVRRVRIDEGTTQVGFARSGPFRGAEGFKPALWAPIIVRFAEDEEGNIRLPIAVDGSVSGELFVETPDFDSMLTLYPQKFTFGPTDPLEVLAYFKPGGLNPQISITVKIGDKKHTTILRNYFQPVELGEHLYLSLGDRLPALEEALLGLVNKADRIGKRDELQPAVREFEETRPALCLQRKQCPESALAMVWLQRRRPHDSDHGQRQAAGQAQRRPRTIAAVAGDG